jgi:hypothetical protein
MIPVIYPKSRPLEDAPMSDYEQGFKDGVERAAQQVCIACQQSQKPENREVAAGVVLAYHRSPDGGWYPCSAQDIRALTPGYWSDFLLSPESMAAMFHEIFKRLAPKFGYKILDDRYTAESQVNVYRNALKHIATHSKDRDTVDEAIQALAKGEPLALWDPRPWEQACEANRGLTIAPEAGSATRTSFKVINSDWQNALELYD